MAAPGHQPCTQPLSLWFGKRPLTAHLRGSPKPLPLPLLCVSWRVLSCFGVWKTDSRSCRFSALVLATAPQHPPPRQKRQQTPPQQKAGPREGGGQQVRLQLTRAERRPARASTDGAHTVRDRGQEGQERSCPQNRKFPVLYRN